MLLLNYVYKVNCERIERNNLSFDALKTISRRAFGVRRVLSPGDTQGAHLAFSRHVRICLATQTRKTLNLSILFAGD